MFSGIRSNLETEPSEETNKENVRLSTIQEETARPKQIQEFFNSSLRQVNDTKISYFQKS